MPTVAPGKPTVQTAASNTFPRGQCTWWAEERYARLTGYRIPWMGNAADWNTNARRYSGWVISSVPVVPSIICLQPGAQGAGGFGHVAVVESKNSDGSLRTSNQNWNFTSATTYVNFRPGAGVSFIYAAGNGTPVPSPAGGGSVPGGGNPIATATFTPLLSQVHNTLIDNEGFYGIALALDEAEQLPGFVDLTDHSVQAFGVPVDVPGLVRSVGATVGDNTIPVLIRGNLIGLGVMIIALLLIKVVLDIGGPAIDVLGALL